uniref:ATP-dependent DNA helicase n=1 Tax=Homalodisca liturata TaxID=320908 RepID=A0A1B6I065_9HEMI
MNSLLIVWDEAPMSPKLALYAIDKFLRDLMREQNKQMGGKIVLLGGDFRQVVSVNRRCHRTQVVQSSIKCTYLWNCIKKMQINNQHATGTRSSGIWTMAQYSGKRYTVNS